MAKIIIVDDDADIRAIAKAVLSSASHEVSLAENAYEAFDLLEKNPYDVLVSDANMPKMSGFELVRRVRSNPRFKNMGVALFTSRREREDIEKAMSLGVNDYILKPLDPLILLNKIESLLKKTQEPSTIEVMLSETEGRADMEVKVEGHILTLSEHGILFQTQYPLKEGEKISLLTQFFKNNLGVTDPQMRVSTVEIGTHPGEWIARIQFIGTSDITLQKIRNWINQRLNKSNRKAG